MLNSFNKYVNETSLSRVYAHFKDDPPIAIITAFRGDYSYKENVARNRKLAAEIKRAGYGYIFVDGHWVEDQGNNASDTSEDSIFVIGNDDDNGKLKGFVRQWVKKYNQDAALFKDEKSTDVALMFKDGKIEAIGRFNPGRIAQAYTKLRGRTGGTFVFESASIEKNWISKVASTRT